MKITEHEHPDHGWGYAIKDDGDNIVVQFLNAHIDPKTDELKNNTQKLAQEEHQKIMDKKGQS